jgi:putative Ca2+/H+ antiporter (TMEM165/GDT1 family)
MDTLNSYIQIENQNLQYFLLSFIIILVSEIGDKTFFIAALLAMKHSPVTVFCGSFLSLALMSVLSAALGHTIFNWLPKQYIGLLASGLFLVFGFKMIFDGYKMTKEEESAELLETEEELNEKNIEHEGDDIEGSSSQAKEHKRPWYLTILSPIFVQAFVLCFLAEWGDRSQISTITLAATGDILYVSLGTVLGHSICTAGAVLGGKYLAEKISVKKLTMLGGVTFLVFAVIYFIESVYFQA